MNITFEVKPLGTYIGVFPFDFFLPTARSLWPKFNMFNFATTRRMAAIDVRDCVSISTSRREYPTGGLRAVMETLPRLYKKKAYSSIYFIDYAENYDLR